VLKKGKKKLWLAFPLTIKAYVMVNFKQVEVEDKELKGTHFVSLNYRTSDLKKVIATHRKKAKFSWSYSPTKHGHEDCVKNWYNSTRELRPSE